MGGRRRGRARCRRSHSGNPEPTQKRFERRADPQTSRRRTCGVGPSAAVTLIALPSVRLFAFPGRRAHGGAPGSVRFWDRLQGTAPWRVEWMRDALLPVPARHALAVGDEGQARARLSLCGRGKLLIRRPKASGEKREPRAWVERPLGVCVVSVWTQEKSAGGARDRSDVGLAGGVWRRAQTREAAPREDLRGRPVPFPAFAGLVGACHRSWRGWRAPDHEIGEDFAAANLFWSGGDSLSVSALESRSRAIAPIFMACTKVLAPSSGGGDHSHGPSMLSLGCHVAMYLVVIHGVSRQRGRLWTLACGFYVFEQRLQ